MWSLLGEWWLEGGRGGHRGGHTLCLNLGMVTRTRSNCANSPMRTRRICVLFCRCFIQFNKKCPLKRLYSSGSIFADLWIQTVVEAHRITLCVFFFTRHACIMQQGEPMCARHMPGCGEAKVSEACPCPQARLGD